MYKIHGYGRGNYFLTDSKGASQIYEAIRRELEEERGVVLETRRKHVTLQLSFDEKEYFTQKQWNKKLISKINEVANEINKRSRRGAASYIYALGSYVPASVCVMDPTKTLTLNWGGI